MSSKRDRDDFNTRIFGKLLVAIHALLIVAAYIAFKRQSNDPGDAQSSRPPTSSETPDLSIDKTPEPEDGEEVENLPDSTFKSEGDRQTQEQGQSSTTQKQPLLERELTPPWLDRAVLVVLLLALCGLTYCLHLKTEIQQDSLFGFLLTGIGLLASLGDNAVKFPKRYLKWFGLVVGLAGLAISMCSILAAIPNS